MSRIFFYIFAFLSVICCVAEITEIALDISIFWCDHLHNFLDHIALLLINWIGIKVNGEAKDVSRQGNP